MNKSLASTLLILLICSLITVAEEAAQESTTQGDYDEIDKGRLKDEPVIYNGVVIKGKGTEVGNNEIKGEVSLPEMGNIKVQNVEDFSSTSEGFKGTAAGLDSSIAGHQIGRGTKFSYNEDTKELHIEDGGLVDYSQSGDRLEEKFYRISGEDGAKVREDGVIVLPKGTKVSKEYYSGGAILGGYKPDYSIEAKADNTEIKNELDGSTIKGNAVFMNQDKETVDIKGGGRIYLEKPKNRMTHWITRVDFEDTGTSTYRRFLRSEGISGPVETTYSNQFRDPITGEPKSGNVAIVWGDHFDGIVNEKNYDGVIYERNTRSIIASSTKTDIGVKGKASVALDGFRYNGLSPDTETQIKTNRGFQQLEVEHPTNLGSNDLPIAKIDWGGKEETLSTHDGKVFETWKTGSLFTKEENTIVEFKSNTGSTISEDGQSVKSYGPKETNNVVITYPTTSLIPPEETQQELSNVAEYYHSKSGPTPGIIMPDIGHYIGKALGLETLESYQERVGDKYDTHRRKAKASIEDWPSEWN